MRALYHLPPVAGVQFFDVQASQQTACEGRIGNHRHAKLPGAWQHIMLDLSATQAVLHLHTRDRTHQVEAAQLVGSAFTETDEADKTFSFQLIHCCCYIFHFDLKHRHARLLPAKRSY
jgi:hypothetical protein